MAKTNFSFRRVILASYSVLVFFLVLLAIIFAGAAILYFRGYKPSVAIPTATPVADQFKDCAEIENNCNDSKCGYYWMCDIADYKNCKVYDCGKDYGVEIASSKGEVLTKRYLKPDMGAVNDKISACRGTVKIISAKCEKSAKKISAEVATPGDCPVEAFVAEIGGKPEVADFTKSGTNRYLLNIPSCGAVSSVAAVGSQGITIGSAAGKY